MNGEASDYRKTELARRRSWFGMKKYAKRMMSRRAFHWVLRLAVMVMPSLKAGGRLPAPASLKEVRGNVDGVSFVMLRPDRCIVAKELYWGKGRRPRTEDDFALTLFARIAARSTAVIDIGAYTGIFTLVSAAVNPRASVHAFEIVPSVYRLLSDNCARNDVLHRVTLHHKGIGPSDGSMLIPDDEGDSALPDFYSSKLRFESGVRVGFISLDDLTRDWAKDERVVVKIDVEGTEADVLKEGQSFLARYTPDILCEILKDVADAPAVEAALAPLGYRFYSVCRGFLQERAQLIPDATYRDWLFTTRTKEDLESMGLSVR